MGKNRVKRNPGVLYDRLVVMPGPSTFPAYYQLVGRVLREAAADRANFEDKDEWFRKWFGSQLVKNSEN